MKRLKLKDQRRQLERQRVTEMEQIRRDLETLAPRAAEHGLTMRLDARDTHKRRGQAAAQTILFRLNGYAVATWRYGTQRVTIGTVKTTAASVAEAIDAVIDALDIGKSSETFPSRNGSGRAAMDALGLDRIQPEGRGSVACLAISGKARGHSASTPVATENDRKRQATVATFPWNAGHDTESRDVAMT